MFGDEFPTVKIGDWVRVGVEILDDGEEVARPGDLGHVVDKAVGSFPTILCERTGRVSDCAPTDFEVLCDAEFARDEKHTPAAPMRRFARAAGKKKGTKN